MGVKSPGVRSPEGSATRRGFSLVEVLLVIVIIGILIGLVVPRIDVANFQVSSAVQALSTTSAVAQREAITKQHDMILIFDAAARQLRLVWDVDSDGIIDANERIRSITLDDRVVFGLGTAPARAFGAAPINFVDQIGGLPALTFHRNGSASGIGGFYLTTRAGAAGAANKSRDTRAAEIVRATGRTEWFRYSGVAWVRGF
jgi:prepilin-type N-terminal cleavage/methylation domain-containing protein